MACKTDDQVVAEHPYAMAKEIAWAAGAGRGLVSGSRIGQQEDCLVVPIRNIKTNRVQAVEVINCQGGQADLWLQVRWRIDSWQYDAQA